LATTSYERDSNGRLKSQFVEAISGKRVELNISERTFPPIALTRASERFADALSVCLERLAELDRVSPKEPSEGAQVIQSFSETVYRLVELIDVYAVDLHNVANLKPNKLCREKANQYGATVKSRRATWALICNRQKHHQDTLVPVLQTFKPSNRFILGFSLCRTAGIDSLQTNKDLHKGRETARSVIIALFQMLHDLLKIDKAAADIIGFLPETSTKAIENIEVWFRFGESLEALANRPCLWLPNERKMFDGLEIASDQVTLRRMSALPVAEQGIRAVSFSGDGVTRTFSII